VFYKFREFVPADDQNLSQQDFAKKFFPDGFEIEIEGQKLRIIPVPSDAVASQTLAERIRAFAHQMLGDNSPFERPAPNSTVPSAAPPMGLELSTNFDRSPQGLSGLVSRVDNPLAQDLEALRLGLSNQHADLLQKIEPGFRSLSPEDRSFFLDQLTKGNVGIPACK
jgi:hypothetical protein